MQMLSPTATFFVVSLLFTGSLRAATFAGLFGLMIPVTGILLVRGFGCGRRTTCTFDRLAERLTCAKEATLPGWPPAVHHYFLDSIRSVEAVTEKNDEPLPFYWRFVKLDLGTTVLTLFPGHDSPESQAEMLRLIQDFLLADRPNGTVSED